MTAVTWDRKPLGDVADLCLGKMLDQNKNRGEPFPYLANVNVRWGAFELDDLRVMRFESKEMDRYGLKFGDIVMCEGGEPGRCAIWKDQIPGMMIQKAIHRIRPKEHLDYRFLFYRLLHLGHTKAFDQYFTGATIKHLPGEKLVKVEIEFPPLPIQQRIAGILSAYDELIENSQRRIKILEAMARGLYRECFVHFRFPGHENHPRVASALGEIPEGWEVKPLFDITKVNYGKSLPTKKLTEDGIFPVYGAAKVIGRFTEYTREQRTIICGCRGSVGEMQITQPQCYVTNNSFTFDPTHPDNFFWLFHTLKERGLRDVVGGSAQPQITLDGISSIELITPPLLLRAHFQQTVQAMFKEIWLLDSQIQNLRRTRDLLLPRLLSGQINVEAP